MAITNRMLSARMRGEWGGGSKKYSPPSIIGHTSYLLGYLRGRTVRRTPAPAASGSGDTETEPLATLWVAPVTWLSLTVSKKV